MATTVTFEQMVPSTGMDVFLSTTITTGCAGGYIGAQIHQNSSTLFTDFALWDYMNTTNTHNVSGHCDRYNNEGHGTQCGFGSGTDKWMWQLGTPYTFNLSMVNSNSSGATFNASLRNEKTDAVYAFGQIFTGVPQPGPGVTIPPQGFDCGRILVSAGFFQEIYTGGNFTSVATISPYFGGVEGVEGGIVRASNMSDCVRAAAITHGCYGGYGGCHNETSHHCIHPHCATPDTPSTMTFSSGKSIPAPADWMPPWSKVLPGGVGRDGPIPPPSSACNFVRNASLIGGTVPPHWGAVQMQWPSPTSAEAAREECCGYCMADPDCVAAVVSGPLASGVCNVFHIESGASSELTLVDGTKNHTVCMKHRS